MAISYQKCKISFQPKTATTFIKLLTTPFLAQFIIQTMSRDERNVFLDYRKRKGITLILLNKASRKYKYLFWVEMLMLVHAG